MLGSVARDRWLPSSRPPRKGRSFASARRNDSAARWPSRPSSPDRTRTVTLRIAAIAAVALTFLATGGPWSCATAGDCVEASDAYDFSIGRRVSELDRDAAIPIVDNTRATAPLDELLAMPCAELCELLRSGEVPDGRYGRWAQDYVRLDSCHPNDERVERGSRWGEPTDERVYSVSCHYSWRACPPADPPRGCAPR
jgi:hypothetical protein